MWQTILTRLVSSLVTLFVIVTIAFFLIRAPKGSPFRYEKDVSSAVRQNIMKKYGLDKPLHIQYLIYLKTLLRGDFGYSTAYSNVTVNEIIAKSLPVSMTVGLAALLFALFAGLATAIVSTGFRSSLVDNLAMAVSMIGITLPSFVIGTLLLLIFSFYLKLLPVAGWGGWGQLILPAVTLGLAPAAYIARISRTSLMELRNRDFIRTARAKGLSEKTVLFKHMLKISLLPVISFLGPAAAGILTGTVVIEKIFSLPGLGRHFVNSALNRDYPLVMGTVIIYAVFLIAFNMLVDISYRYIDPRIREQT